MNDIPQMTAGRHVASYLVMLAVAVAGIADWRTCWWAIAAGAAVLMFINNRDQHRRLEEAFPGLSERYVLALSIASHLANNAIFCALAFALGAAFNWLFR
jgi:hypothetical protein